MRFPPILPLYGLSLLLALPAIAATPLRVDTTQAQTPLTQVLADLAKQSGTTILTDSSATASLPATHLQAGNVGSMLTKLDALAPGMTWRKVYLPPNAPMPTGLALAQEVRALQAIMAPSLVVASPVDSLTFTHSLSAVSAPAGMQSVYLVMNDTPPAVPAAPAAPAPATTPVDQTTTGMQAVADTFSKMTPAEQSQALPAMFQQFQRIMQSMDPAVRQQVMSQMGQQWQQGGNGQPGAGP